MLYDFRKQITTISNILRHHSSVYSPIEFWDLTFEIGRSSTLKSCPWLFEFFILFFFPSPVVESILEERTITESVKQRYLFKYYFFIHFCCKLIGTQNIDFFFWLTFCLQYYGCSNSGIQFLSKFGVCFSDRHYRRTTPFRASQIRNNNRLQISQHHTIVWLDNYSKLLKIQIPSRKEKPIPNYSATAFCFTPKLIAPSPPFGMVNQWFHNLVSHLQYYRDFSYQQSICKDYEVLTVPLRVNRSTYKSYTQIPDTILSANCTSNSGLDECLEYIKATIPPGEFFTIKCDINIYWRLIKYYSIPEKNILVSSMVPFLGVWHIFKIVAIKVFQAFVNIIIADCCFDISIKTVLSAPPLPFALTILLYIYPNIGNLLTRIEEAIETCDHKYIIHLQNLKTFLSNWIPVILDFGLSISSNNFELFISRLPSVLLILLECKCHSYSSAIFVFLSQLNFLFENHREYYNHIQENFDAYVEEKNEILLSLLARSVISDPLKYDHEHLARNFSFLAIARKIINQFSDQDHPGKVKGTEKMLFKKDIQSDEALSFRNTFQIKIEEIKQNKWVFYTLQPLYRKNQNKEFTSTKLFYEDVNKNLHHLALKIQRKLNNFINDLT
jgi:hypothetical protein